MLSPLILPSFFIVIENLLSVPAYPGILRRNRKHLIYAPACCRHAVKFRLGRGRVLPVSFRIETHTAKEDGGVIGGKCGGKFIRRVVGKSLSRPSVCIHHIDIEISVPVRGKSDFGSVITPDRHKIVSLMEGQLLCLSSLRGNPIKISFIGKYNSRSIRRNGRITQPVRVLL